MRRTPFAVTVAVLLTATSALTVRRDRDDAQSVASAELAARVSVLRERVRLAPSDTPLLVLDPAHGTLSLARGGATLREWPVSAVSAGRRRLGFGRGTDHVDWRTRVWADGHVDPPAHRDRRVIVSDEVTPPDLTGAVDWIPPTPEEAVPTPPRFLVHYADGLGVEVVADAARAGHGIGRLLRRLLFTSREILPVSWDRYRVRIVMPAAEAGALYRGFPAGALFVAVLPTP
jgi:hypothetical protein